MIAGDIPLPPVGVTGALRRTALIVAALNLAYFAKSDSRCAMMVRNPT